MSAEHVARQLECIDFTRVTVAKIGMLGAADIIRTVAALIPAHVRIVLDPVLGASSGAALLSESGLVALKRLLIPRAELITPKTIDLAMADGGAYRVRHRGLPAHIRYVPEQHRTEDLVAQNFPECETSYSRAGTW